MDNMYESKSQECSFSACSSGDVVAGYDFDDDCRYELYLDSCSKLAKMLQKKGLEHSSLCILHMKTICDVRKCNGSSDFRNVICQNTYQGVRRTLHLYSD